MRIMQDDLAKEVIWLKLLNYSQPVLSGTLFFVHCKIVGKRGLSLLIDSEDIRSILEAFQSFF